MKAADANSLKEVAARIKEMREIIGFSIGEMAKKAEVTEAEYKAIEAGKSDPSFTFLHKCALTFGVDITALLEGHTAKLSGYMVTRKGKGVVTAKEDGLEIQNMAAMFQNRLATPYYCTYEYDEKLQNAPIHTTTHAGQEFDVVMEGSMKIQVGDHVEILNAGDSIMYKSSTPHGMIAVGGKSVTFIAMIMAGSAEEQKIEQEVVHIKKDTRPLIASKFIEVEEDGRGALKHIRFKNTAKFNFAFDIVDEIAKKDPIRLAMLHVSDHFTERRFTF